MVGSEIEPTLPAIIETIEVKMHDNSDTIVSYFSFLIDIYGFNITQKEFDFNTMGNSIVVLSSSKYNIEIVIDRNQVLVRIGEINENPYYWFDFMDIMKYYAPKETAYIFPEKNELNSWDDVVRNQLERISFLLNHYCKPILKGDSWNKDELIKIREKWSMDMIRTLKKLRPI